MGARLLTFYFFALVCVARALACPLEPIAGQSDASRLMDVVWVAKPKEKIQTIIPGSPSGLLTLGLAKGTTVVIDATTGAELFRAANLEYHRPIWIGSKLIFRSTGSGKESDVAFESGITTSDRRERALVFPPKSIDEEGGLRLKRDTVVLTPESPEADERIAALTREGGRIGSSAFVGLRNGDLVAGSHRGGIYHLAKGTTQWELLNEPRMSLLGNTEISETVALDASTALLRSQNQVFQVRRDGEGKPSVELVFDSPSAIHSIAALGGSRFAILDRGNTLWILHGAKVLQKYPIPEKFPFTQIESISDNRLVLKTKDGSRLHAKTIDLNRDDEVASPHPKAPNPALNAALFPLGVAAKIALYPFWFGAKVGWHRAVYGKGFNRALRSELESWSGRLSLLGYLAYFITAPEWALETADMYALTSDFEEESDPDELVVVVDFFGGDHHTAGSRAFFERVHAKKIKTGKAHFVEVKTMEEARERLEQITAKEGRIGTLEIHGHGSPGESLLPRAKTGTPITEWLTHADGRKITLAPKAKVRFISCLVANGTKGRAALEKFGAEHLPEGGQVVASLPVMMSAHPDFRVGTNLGRLMPIVNPISTAIGLENDPDAFRKSPFDPADRMKRFEKRDGKIIETPARKKRN